MSANIDHIKAAIEGKILDAIASHKWKTIVATTGINEKGFVVKVTKPVEREYQITIRKMGRKGGAK